MARYKWNSPAEWLAEMMETEIAAANSDGTHEALQNCITNLHGYATSLLAECDSDTVQDIFQDEMSDEGYFRDLDEVPDEEEEG